MSNCLFFYRVEKIWGKIFKEKGEIIQNCTKKIKCERKRQNPLTKWKVVLYYICRCERVPYNTQTKDRRDCRKDDNDLCGFLISKVRTDAGISKGIPAFLLLENSCVCKRRMKRKSYLAVKIAKSLLVHCMGTPLSHVLRFTAVMPRLLNTHPPSGGNGFTYSNCSRNDGQASHAVMPHSFPPPIKQKQRLNRAEEAQEKDS